MCPYIEVMARHIRPVFAYKMLQFVNLTVVQGVTYACGLLKVQILDETDCISHSTNTLGKGMNPIILPPAMGK